MSLVVLYSMVDAPKREEWTVVDTQSPKIKEDALREMSNDVLKKLEQKIKEGIIRSNSMGFWEKIMIKVIDNIQISIKYF